MPYSPNSGVIWYFGAYAMDVIARCSFGIQLDSRKDPNNPFLKAFYFLVWRSYFVYLFNPSTSLFFKDVAMQIINERKNLKEDQKPKDFLQLLLEAEKEDSNSKNGKKNKLYKLDDVVSQCVMFFMVGYFTTAATLSFLAHQLAIKPKIQEKLIKEIDEVLKGKEKIHIDDVTELRYLDAVLQEILRYYTPAARLKRRPVEDYKLGDTWIIIPKSTLINVPIYAVNHDPQYFPEPDKFDPERFMPENKNTILPFTNLPFGEGPRNCIGKRFASMEIKMALVKVLQNIRFKPGKNTKEKSEFFSCGGLHRPQNVFLNIEPNHHN
ncbi:cytochrome P450 3A11-like [Centruroides vittatus]|uniref:cytochrome P450 3A11-like n=1 Tax=Centruroides vittatus TaxID=120091 RepID=UPI00350F3746